MKKILFLSLFTFFSVVTTSISFAQSSSFVSIVNPVRGNDFWDLKDQKLETSIKGQIEILNKYNLPATWLIRTDALFDVNIINILKERNTDDKGLFLEITPSWTQEANVSYRESSVWHAAGSAFLTGYERDEREKLIDSAFEKFKKTFGFYPASVGAWWIDAYSLGYMQKKYGISTALIVADQYSTDNYQIWGQYFGTPYYPAKNNALHPAQSLENKLDIVIMQWANRDPVNGYGNGVIESTFSVQANDYIDYHDLNTGYFSSLIDVYTKQKFNTFGHVVVGLENSYSWNKYSDEYEKQIRVISVKKKSNGIKVLSMKDFAKWYQSFFPNLSPAQVIIADDPLGSNKKTIWFMNNYYRAAWFYNEDGSVFRDIRQYIDGEEELCFKTRCDNVNFATSATRVLDDVSFGHKWVIDQGKINDFKVEKKGEEVVASYKNEAGNFREIGFLPRDIKVDGKISSIDGAILDANKKDQGGLKNVLNIDGKLKWNIFSVTSKIGKFFLFLIFALFIPGLVILNKSFRRDSTLIFKIFLSTASGLAMLTLLFYITGLLNLKPLIYIYFLISLIIFLRFKIYKSLFINNIKIGKPVNLIPGLIILAGTIFQVVPTFKSSLNFGYGLGFWGPNAHDGVWHLALINQLIKSIPPENPVFSGSILKNYHFFYDLLVAATNYSANLPIADLIFRFYPVVFSLLLGVGSYYLILRLFSEKIGEQKAKIGAYLSLYLIYFSGSFGWIVEYIKERHFGGESAFWANQAVSFNLNPPFAVSLIVIIALFHIIFSKQKNLIMAIILAGTLIGFKSYGAVLILGSMFLVGFLKKQLYYLLIFAGALILSIWIFFSNFNATLSLLIFMPFWFIHAMIDSPDRVGWVRLTLARETGFATNNWFKLITSEVMSLVIFIFGNLGMRFVSLLSLVKIKSIFADEKLLLIFIFSSFSFLIPILFIQSGNPWNTIQFSYYGLYTASLTGGLMLSLLIFKIPKYISVLLIFITLIIAPINSVITANGYLGKNPHAFVSSLEEEGLKFLSAQPDGVVLTYPYDEKLKTELPEPWRILIYDSTAYVSAFSAKSVFLEDNSQNQILLTDFKKRLVASKDFFLKPTSQGANFLKSNSIKYVYLPKLFNRRLDENSGIAKNIFENEEVVIYKANLEYN